MKSTSGSTLIEVLIATSLFVVVFMSSLAMVRSGQDFSKATLGVSVMEDQAQQMLYRVEEWLANARAVAPSSTLSFALGAGAARMTLGGTGGFPPAGEVIVERGAPTEERVAYRLDDTNTVILDSLVRGQGCSAPSDHPQGSPVMWSGLAIPVRQANPPPSAVDGETQENGRTVFFQGDGTGFAYQLPVDPAGGTNYLTGTGVNWGSEVRGLGAAIGTGFAAIYYEAQTTFDEAVRNFDLNGDGDRVDTFDVGQLRRIAWNATNTATVDDVGMGLSSIIQEQCNHGGDLDSDGADDPMFLWDQVSNQLHVRLFVLGGTDELPVVRQVESVLFLRNEEES